MDRFEAAYQAALVSIEDSIAQVIDSPAFLSGETVSENNIIETNLDGWDYCYAVAIGVAGVMISTNEAFGHYLDQIHKAASGSSGEYDRFQTLLGQVFHHQGDHIDVMGDSFINRDKHNAYCLFHRLLWGHDIMDIGQDNPFRLMVEQSGMRGVLQAVRHLLADTMSKQGLPLPGSSFLDFHDETGKLSNHLIKVAQQLSDETYGTKAKAHEIYAHMTTIRAQDVTAGVVVKSLAELYFLMRGVDDKIRRAQIRLIGYTINFLGEAVLGCIRQQGIPYINLPVAGMMVSSFANLWHLDSQQIRKLQRETDRLTTKTSAALWESDHFEIQLSNCDTPEALIRAYDQAEVNIDELLDFFGEDAK